MPTPYVKATVIDEPDPGDKMKTWLWTAIIILALLSISVGAYLFLNQEEESEDPDIPLNAKIEVERDTVNVNELFILDASNSTGKITEYIWDLNTGIDSNGDGNPRNDRDQQGKVISTTYRNWGDYTILLIIHNSSGGVSKDQQMIHVGYYEQYEGSVSPSSPQADQYFYAFDDQDSIAQAQNLTITLTYSTGQLVGNDLLMTLYDGGNDTGPRKLEDTSDDERDSGETQVEQIKMNFREIASGMPGTWNAEVTWIRSPLSSTTVHYKVTIEVHY